MIKNLHKKIFFAVDDFPYWLADPIKWLACKFLGHEVIPDQCGKPEHNFCAWCGKSCPFASFS